MSFNGLGQFSLLLNWVTDRNNGIKILASRMMTQEQDIADGLSMVMTTDGQGVVTANIPLNSKKITLLASATLATDAMNLGQSRTGSAEFASVSGSGIYTAAFSPAVTAVSDGFSVKVYFNDTNATTATATFNPDGLGAANILKAGAVIAAPLDIKKGVGFLTRYGANWYYTSPAVSVGPFGMIDGGIISGTSSAVSNTAYMLNVTSTAGQLIFGTGATGDLVPVTIFGTNNAAFVGLFYGTTATITTFGGEGFVAPRWTGASRGWIF